MDKVMKLASQRAVVIFSNISCCMCHTIKMLFCDLACNPAVHEIDEDPKRRDTEKALLKLLGKNNTPVPAVFIGGRFIGSTDHVMSLHLSGNLISLLREAGAIWL